MVAELTEVEVPEEARPVPKAHSARNGKKSNGKGALAAIPSVGPSSPAVHRDEPALQLVWFDPRQLLDDEQNERGALDLDKAKGNEALQELAQSVGELGVLEPLRVYRAPDGVHLVSGHRRKYAALLAGLPLVPCVVTPPPAGAVERALARLVSNCQREDIPPLEKARTMRTLLDTGLSQAALGAQMGMSQGEVSRLTGLLRLPQGVQDLVAEGKLTAGHAAALLGVKQPDFDWRGKQLATAEEMLVKLAERAVSDGSSVRAVEQRVAEHNRWSLRAQQNAEEDRKRQADAQRAEAERQRALTAGELSEEEAARARYDEELKEYTAVTDRNRKARGRLIKKLLQEATAWDETKGPTLDHLFYAAIVLMQKTVGYGPRADDMRAQIKAAFTQGNRVELLNIMARLALTELSPNYDNAGVGDYGGSSEANKMWGLNEKLKAVWEREGLVDPPRPVHYLNRPKAESAALASDDPAERAVVCPRCKKSLLFIRDGGRVKGVCCADFECKFHEDLSAGGEARYRECGRCGVVILGQFEQCLDCDEAVVEARVDAQLAGVGAGTGSGGAA